MSPGWEAATLPDACISMRPVPTDSDKAATSTGQDVLSHFLMLGERGTTPVKEPWLRFSSQRPRTQSWGHIKEH